MFEYPSQVAQKLISALGEVSRNLPHLDTFVEVLFCASLLREEGRAVTFGVVYPGAFDELHPTPERVHGYAPWHAVDFDPFIRFDAAGAAKFASLAGGEGEYLISHCAGDELVISGVGYRREFPWYDFQNKLLTARVVGPGSLRFFHGDNEVLSYASGVASRRHRWPFLSPQAALEDVLAAMGKMSEIAPAKNAVSAALRDLCSELIQRGHGGIIAICSKDDPALRRPVDANVLKTPLEYGRLFVESWEASAVVGSRPNPTPEENFELERSSTASDRALSLIGRMTMIDGAVLITPDLSVVGFGAKLPAPEDTPPVMCVLPNDTLEVLDMIKRGTRHRSAACFVAGGPRRIALIASADGDAAAMFNGDGGQVLYWPVRDRYGAFET